MTVGSIVSLARNETDQSKINFAIQQALERVGGKQVNSSVATTAAYTALASDFMIDVAGATTVTLPSASSAPGQLYCFKKTDAAGTTVTIDPSSNTIDGSTSATLTSSYSALIIQSNGTQWDKIFSTATSLSSGSFLQVANNLSELSTSATTARTNLGLGTAATLNVGTSANNVVQLSTSAKLPAVDGSQLTNMSSSGRLIAGTPLVLNPYAASSATTQAHGLGVAPTYIDWAWQCLTGNLNYSVGNIIRQPAYMGYCDVLADATNVVCIAGATLPILADKTGFAQTAITAADWKLTLTPYSLT